MDGPWRRRHYLGRLVGFPQPAMLASRGGTYLPSKCHLISWRICEYIELDCRVLATLYLARNDLYARVAQSTSERSFRVHNYTEISAIDLKALVHRFSNNGVHAGGDVSCTAVYSLLVRCVCRLRQWAFEFLHA